MTLVMEEYDVEYCYLFGSYAKGYATDGSDVDICISSNMFEHLFGMIDMGGCN